MHAWLAARVGRDLERSFAQTATEIPRDEALARYLAVMPHDESGIGGPSGVQPSGYWYKEAGYPWRARSFVDSGTLDGDDRPASFFLVSHHGPTGLVLGYRAPWSLVIAAVRAIFAYSTRGANVMASSDDAAYGFILTTYVGYVPHELHDDETVYRVSRWHP